MYISIYYQALLCLAASGLIVCIVWLFLLIIAGKMEDKRRKELLEARQKETPIINLDEYERFDSSKYEWEGEKESQVN